MYSIPSLFFDDSIGNDMRSCFIKPYTNTNNIDKASVLMETHLLSFVLEGEKSVIMPDSTVTAGKESFLLLKKGQCLMTERLSSSNSFKSLLIFFDDNFFFQFIKKHDILLPKTITDTRFLVYRKNSLLNSIAHSLLPYFDHKKDLDERVMKVKLEELLLQIVDMYGPDPLSFLVSTSKSIIDVKFIKTVESNVTNGLNCKEIAFLCNLSHSTFRRKFFQLYGTTPGKWLTEMRLKKAEQLLNNPFIRPSEVYLKVGFDSQSSFTQAFKKQYGSTPKQYQRK